MTALEKSSYLNPLEAEVTALGDTLALRGLDEYVRDEAARFNQLIDLYCQHIEYIEAEETSPFEETLVDLRAAVPDGIMVLAQSTARQRVVSLSPLEIGLESLRPVAPQVEFANDVARFVIAACGRRSGKTHIATVRQIIAALLTDRPDAWFVFAAPTHQQAKRIFWQRLLRIIPKSLVREIRYSDLSIRLVNGALLSVLGLDKPQRVEVARSTESWLTSSLM